MQHNITIVQTIAKTIEVNADTAEEAVKIGNHILTLNMIPIDSYDLLEANVSAEIKDNIIPFYRQTV